MSFLKRQPKSAHNEMPKKHTKRRFWRIFSICLISILLVLISYVAFLIASGSKAFENGLGGQSLIKTFYGKEKLKGEDENRINVLVMGMGGQNHPGGLLTDSIMVLSIRPSDKKVAILSVPRDLLVGIPGFGNGKINSAYADGYNGYFSKNCNSKKANTACKDTALTEGAKLSAETVSNVLGVPIHYYLTLDFSGFEKIIDILGGVDVYVDKAIYDPYFPDEAMKGYSPFKITAGQHHLDGKTALKYARSRETTSDFDRAKRQQQIVAAAKDKAMTVGFLSNPKKVADATATLGDSIKMNFTPGEMKSFLSLMGDVSTGNIVTEVLTNAPDGLLIDSNDGVYYLKPRSGNFKAIQDLMKNIFGLQKKEYAKITIENASKTSGIGTSLAQELEDKGYSIAAISMAKQKSTKTVIYDYTGGSKSNTLNYLKNKLNSQIQRADRKPGDVADIKIVLGDDYTQID